MLELFRFFRLGIVNVVGVTVPGVLFLLFAGVGFVLPLALATVYLNELLTKVPQSDVWLAVGSAYRENKVTMTVLFVVFAYVIGYIIRLSSPDELDRKSAKKSMRLVAGENSGLAEKMAGDDHALDEKLQREKHAEEEEARRPWWRRRLLRTYRRLVRAYEKLKPARKRGKGVEAGKYCDDVTSNDIAASIHKHFPYRGERMNKFPYDNFRDYLHDRGFDQFAALVPSKDKPESAGSPATSHANDKWTKTAVNMMKLEVHLQSPVLAAVIESNEAHIRLLSGAWQAINACRRIVLAGIALGLLGGLANVYAVWNPSFFPSSPLPSFLPCLFVGGVLFLGMRWARRRIETLFHHQRVRELTHIVGCAYFACVKYRGAQADGRGEEARAGDGEPGSPSPEREPQRAGAASRAALETRGRAQDAPVL